jgi:hypothetical protein
MAAAYGVPLTQEANPKEPMFKWLKTNLFGVIGQERFPQLALYFSNAFTVSVRFQP